MFKNWGITGMIAVLLVAADAGFAQAPPAKATKANAPVLTLSPKLRGALIAEMAGVKQGVAEITGFLATGEWGATAQRAERLRDSYIMKQKLTRTELEELERALPANFVEMDEAFHRHSDGLARAAKARNYELAVFYFSKMMEGCGNCHAHYATHVFQGFK
jgi:hypothetical protein